MAKSLSTGQVSWCGFPCFAPHETSEVWGLTGFGGDSLADILDEIYRLLTEHRADAQEVADE